MISERNSNLVMLSGTSIFLVTLKKPVFSKGSFGSSDGRTFPSSSRNSISSLDDEEQTPHWTVTPFSLVTKVSSGLDTETVKTGENERVFKTKGLVYFLVQDSSYSLSNQKNHIDITFAKIKPESLSYVYKPQ